MPLKIKSNFFELLKLNYISIFYSSFIPGQASGELVKGIKLAKSEGSHEKVWIPIFIDKITNLLIVFIIGFIAIIFDKNFKDNTVIIFAVSLSTVFLSCLTIILFSENTAKFIRFMKDIISKTLKAFRINTEFLKHFSLSYFEDYKKHDLLMFETLLWSFLIKLPHIFAFYVLALSLNINLNLIQSAWFFSIISIVTLLPISFSGLGVREGASIFILSKASVDNASALSLSLLIFIIGVLIALIGGITELFFGHKSSK